MKIAVVHDYFTQLGGAEKVAEALYQMAPEAELIATVAFKKSMPAGLLDVAVGTSWMQKLPWIERYYRLYFLLYPFGVHSLDLSRYDLVLSSSSGYAKGIWVGPSTIHVCYCHTPMRWVWNFEQYSRRESMSFLRRVVLPPLVRGLRMWDESAARQPDHFIANSKSVALRIKSVYGRTAEVIYPPVEVRRFAVGSGDGDYYLVLSRLVSYKRIDLAVKACALLNRKLVVIGDGPHRSRLMQEAGASTVFLGRLPDEEVARYISGCKALLFPGEEDFGIAPLEVAAAGRPSIAFRGGGALETVIEDVTGVFFDRQEPEELAKAIERFERMKWSKTALRQHAESFCPEVFETRMRAFLARVGVKIQGRALSAAREEIQKASEIAEVRL